MWGAVGVFFGMVLGAILAVLWTSGMTDTQAPQEAQDRADCDAWEAEARRALANFEAAVALLREVARRRIRHDASATQRGVRMAIAIEWDDRIRQTDWTTGEERYIPVMVRAEVLPGYPARYDPWSGWDAPAGHEVELVAWDTTTWGEVEIPVEEYERLKILAIEYYQAEGR